MTARKCDICRLYHDYPEFVKNTKIKTFKDDFNKIMLSKVTKDGYQRVFETMDEESAIYDICPNCRLELVKTMERLAGKGKEKV